MCWPNVGWLLASVCDAWPTVSQHWVDASYSLGIVCFPGRLPYSPCPRGVLDPARNLGISPGATQNATPIISFAGILNRNRYKHDKRLFDCERPGRPTDHPQKHSGESSAFLANRQFLKPVNQNACVWSEWNLVLVYSLEYRIWIFTHLKLCLAVATHNFKWVKIIRICSIWYQTLANLNV